MSFTKACATCPRDSTRSTGSVQEMLCSNLFFHKTPLYYDNYVKEMKFQRDMNTS